MILGPTAGPFHDVTLSLPTSPTPDLSRFIGFKVRLSMLEWGSPPPLSPPLVCVYSGGGWVLFTKVEPGFSSLPSSCGKPAPFLGTGSVWDTGSL